MLESIRDELLQDVSIRDKKKYVSLKWHTKNVKEAFLSLPGIAELAYQPLQIAPYLFGLYFVIALLEVSTHIGYVTEPARAFGIAMTALILVVAANAFCYIETFNTYATTEPITNQGWYVIRRIPRLFAVMFLTIMFIFIGLFMLVIPGIYLALKLSLAAPACIIDDLGIRESFITSMERTKGKLTMIYVTFSLGGLILPFILLGMIFLPSPLPVVLLAASMTFIPVLIHVAISIIYLDEHESSTVVIP